MPTQKLTGFVLFLSISDERMFTIDLSGDDADCCSTLSRGLISNKSLSLRNTFHLWTRKKISTLFEWRTHLKQIPKFESLASFMGPGMQDIESKFHIKQNPKFEFHYISEQESDMRHYWTWSVYLLEGNILK